MNPSCHYLFLTLPLLRAIPTRKPHPPIPPSFNYMRVREDAHHVFVQCPKFTTLRESYTTRLRDATRVILSTYSLPPEDLAFIMERVSHLFLDSEVWPSRRTAFYLGILPRLVPHSHVCSVMHTRVAHQAHTLSIQLAGRIWGSTRRAAHVNHKVDTNRNEVTPSFPFHLTYLLCFTTFLFPPSPSHFPKFISFLL